MFFANTLANNSGDVCRKWLEPSPVFQKIIKATENQMLIGTFPETTTLPFFLPCSDAGHGKDGSGGEKINSLTRRSPILQALLNLPISARNSS